MNPDWRYERLGNLVTLQSGGTPAKSNASYWSGDIPWLSAKDMKSFRVYDTEDHISEVGARNGTRIAPRKSVFLLVRGMTLLSDVPVSVAKRPMAFNQDVKAIQAIAGKLDEEFLPYSILGLKSRLLDRVDLAGHGTGRINTDELLNMPMVVPPLPEQRAIAHILGTLDDKIELNRRMNQTLEEIACALFHSWFVAFDPVRAKAEGRQPAGMDAATAALFPDSFEESELGEIPAGWTYASLSSVVKLNPKRQLLKGQVAPYLEMSNVPTKGHRASDWSDRPYGSGMRFQNGDVLLARITPCLENGKTALVDFLGDGQVGWGSTEFIVMCALAPLSSIWAYCLARDDDFRSFAIRSMSGTSGRQRVPAEAIGRYVIAVPTPQIAGRFADLAAPMFESVKVRDEESATLAALRDSLLPKLLSGEVRVGELATMSPQAVGASA